MFFSQSRLAFHNLLCSLKSPEAYALGRLVLQCCISKIHLDDVKIIEEIEREYHVTKRFWEIMENSL